MPHKENGPLQLIKFADIFVIPTKILQRIPSKARQNDLHIQMKKLRRNELTYDPKILASKCYLSF